MQTVASDLSPFYLDAARKNVAYWKRQRQSGDLLGTDLAGAGTTFMQCAAESVPAPDESFDVVRCGLVGGQEGLKPRLANYRVVYIAWQ
jgi:ubiquinone/menaquinone biosynthesis C-methylase UbiE